MQTCAIVLNYFGAEKTRKCVRSLMDQAVETICLVDNSVSTTEVDKLKRIIEDLSTKSTAPKILLLVNDENLGFGKAINRAILHDMQNIGGHDYYLLMNNDAQATQGMVEGLAELMHRQQDIDLISPLIVTESGEIDYFWYHPLFGAITRKKSAFSFPYLTGCCLMLRKTLVEQGPLFDEDFFMYGEDAYLTWRLRKRGGKVFCAKNTRVLHEGTGSSDHGGFFYEYHVARGHILLALKMSKRLYEFPLFLLGRVVYLFTRAMVRSIRYANLAPITAFFLCCFPLKVRLGK